MNILHHTSVIDGRENSGTARIALDVIWSLSKIPGINQFFLHYENSTDGIYKVAGSNEIRLRKNKIFKYRFLYFLIYALKIRLGNLIKPSQKIIFDVSHWHVFRVYPFFWLIPAKKHVVTMHDAGHYILPHTQTFANKIFMLNIKLNLNNIHKIIVLSENAKANLIKFAKIPKEKIEVIYPSTKFDKIISKTPAGMNTLLQDSKLIICNSRWQKHKNIENLIAGFDRFLTKSKEKNYVLILAGKPRQDYSAPTEMIHNCTWKNQIKIMPDLLDSELAWLYDNSIFSAFPSLHEGFGLPVLESMSRGCPAVVDRNTATNEVVGGSGMAIDMRSVKEISESFAFLTTRERDLTKFREEAIKRAQDFNWAKSIDKLILIYSYK